MIDNYLFDKFIVNYFKQEIDMANMGHKELGRNNVYLIPDKQTLLKVYSDKRRWAAEVASLKFLQNKDLMVPRLIDHGVFEDGLCWIIMDRLKDWSTFADFQIEKNRKRGSMLLSQNFPEDSLFKLGYAKMVLKNYFNKDINVFISGCRNNSALN